MQHTLNIYKGKEIEKTYTADEYDIMFGTIEDLVDLIDTDRLTGAVKDIDFVGAVAELLKGGFGQVKSLLKEIFPEVTDDELKHTKIKDVMLILVDVVKYGFVEMAGAGNAKN